MPLRAIIDGKEVISTELSSKEWTNLKRENKRSSITIVLPCCNQVGNLRTSKLGLNHFYHKTSDNCNYKPESSQHLRSKAEIVKACRKNKWNATPEYSEGDWIADVLAVGHDRRIAFEVQWSKQSFEETKRRQNRYKVSDVKGCWLMRTIPKELRLYNELAEPDMELPIFRIYETEEKDIMVDLKIAQLTLFDFIDSLFTGRVKLCKFYTTLSKQTINIHFYEKRCWKCKKEQHAYYVDFKPKTNCGDELYIDAETWDRSSLEKHFDIIGAIKNFQQTHDGSHLKIGKIKKRFSKAVDSEYLSFGCYYCDAIFGYSHMTDAHLYHWNDHNLLSIKTVVEFEPVYYQNVHWCYSAQKKFCCTKKTKKDTQ